MLPRLLLTRVKKKCGGVDAWQNNSIVSAMKVNKKKKPDRFATVWLLSVVPGAGIEPARLAARDFESRASTNSTTRATLNQDPNYGTFKA